MHFLFQRRYALLAMSLFAATYMAAQPKMNSPYSRYGLGDLAPQAFASQLGIGHLTIANHDPYHLNPGNPAAYARLRTTTLETGLWGKYGQYRSKDASYNAFSGNLAYLSLGFTLKSPINAVLDRVKSPWNFGMGLSLTPYNTVGYNIQATDSTQALGRVNSLFEGSGGLYRLAWNSAARYKQTALGMTAGWTFGRSVYTNTTTVSDALPTFQSNFRDAISMRGAFVRLGAQHDFVLKYAQDKESPEHWITLGAIFEGSHHLRARADQLRLRSRGALSNGTFLNADTLLFNRNAARTVRLPMTLGVGIQYVMVDRFKIGAQYQLETWDNYSNEVRPEKMRTTQAISAGVEIIPDYASYNHYLRRARYRFGAYFREDPRIVNGQTFNDVGVTAGLGLPIVLPRQQTSFVNVALEVGQLGANSAVKETYYRMTVGFTLNDNSWFYKRRFE